MLPSFFMPESLPGFVVVDDAVRNADELAAYFWDPDETRIRLDAWGWVQQAEREFESDEASVAVSIHTFETTAGAQLASSWFRERRMADLDLKPVPAPELLFPRSSERVFLVAVENAAEYSLYLLHGVMAGRLTVTGSIGGTQRIAVATWVAQQVLDQVPYKGS
jgi:hypothetical protein